jgi:hypothetical protein
MRVTTSAPVQARGLGERGAGLVVLQAQGGFGLAEHDVLCSDEPGRRFGVAALACDLGGRWEQAELRQ